MKLFSVLIEEPFMFLHNGESLSHSYRYVFGIYYLNNLQTYVSLNSQYQIKILFEQYKIGNRFLFLGFFFFKSKLFILSSSILIIIVLFFPSVYDFVLSFEWIEFNTEIVECGIAIVFPILQTNRRRKRYLQLLLQNKQVDLTFTLFSFNCH